MRAAIYARVSTEDAVEKDGKKPRKTQDPENQLRELRRWCAAAGHELVAEYVDRESGRLGVNGREQFRRMFEAAHRREFDLLVFWSLDRLSREGMRPTIKHLERLDSYGVKFHSYTESFLSSTDEFMRDMLLALLSCLARQEARRISERTKAGLARVRAEGSKSGKPIGRQPLSHKKRESIATLLAAGHSVRRVARDLNIDRKTVKKYRAAQGEPAKDERESVEQARRRA